METSSTRLSYNLISASTEDTDYPLREIALKNSIGWSSVRFCSYPQEIVIQFHHLVHITQAAFLFHEHKIPSRLNLSFFFPESTKDFYVEHKQAPFESIGFIQPDTNEKTNFKARELRKVFLNVNAYYIRLVFEKNYSNRLNSFQQVALISAEFSGFALKGGPDNVKINYSKGITDHVYDTDIEEICGDLVRYLNKKLGVAMENEMYEDCKVIRELLDKVVGIGKKIYTIESRKILAVKSEDFDTAKRLKAEADSYREQLERISLKKEDSSAQNSALKPNSQVIDDKRSEAKVEVEAMRIRKEQEDYLQELANERKNHRSNHPQDRRQSFSKQNPKEPESTPYDEVIIPALMKKTDINAIDNMEEYDNSLDDSNYQPPLEELTKEQVQSYELLLKYIDEEALQKLFSRHIQYKEEGIDLFINELPKMFISSSEEFKALSSLILSLTMTFLEDKHPITVVKGLEVLYSLLEHINANVEHAKPYFTLTDRLLTLIKKRTADINVKVRTKAIDLYCFLLTLGFCDYNNLINELLNNDIKYAEVNPMSAMQIQSKLVIIDTIISGFDSAYQNGLTDLELFPYSPIARFLKINVSNSKSNIRKESRRLIGKFIRQFGWSKIAAEVLNVNQRELLKLKEEIPEIRTYIDEHNQSGSSRLSEDNKNHSRSQSPKGSKKEKCSQCKGLVASSEMDKHKESECLMFSQCVKCEEIVEVKKLTFHFLVECQFKGEYKQCQRCKEAVLQVEYEQHKRDNKCNPTKGGNAYNRCPLCHKDIPPNDRGFHTHLVVDGCLKQGRKAVSK